MAPVNRSNPMPQRSLVELVQTRQTQEGRHRVIIAANERSRNPGMDLNLSGVRFENYLKNPVVLYAHDDNGLPIGQTLSVGHDPQGRLVAEFQFNSGDPFAARVENAWLGGFLRAASIRWLPLRVVEVADPDTGETRLRSEESDLLEWSIVPVPADPDTVKQAARALNLPEELFRVAPDLNQPEPSTRPPVHPPHLGGLSARVAALEQRLTRSPADGGPPNAWDRSQPADRDALAAAAARLSQSIKERSHA